MAWSRGPAGLPSPCAAQGLLGAFLLKIISRLAFPRPQREEEEEYNGRQSAGFLGKEWGGKTFRGWKMRGRSSANTRRQERRHRCRAGNAAPTSPAAVGGFGLLFSADSQLRLSVSLSGGSQRRFSARPGDQSHAPESRGAKPGQPREGGCWDSPGGGRF